MQGEKQPLWRDLRVVHLYDTRDLGSALRQFAVNHATQPVEMIVHVVEARLRVLSDDDSRKKQLQEYLERETWQQKVYSTQTRHSGSKLNFALNGLT